MAGTSDQVFPILRSVAPAENVTVQAQRLLADEESAYSAVFSGTIDRPVIAGPDAVVRVRDLATVRSTFKDAETISRIDGESAITIAVKKRIGANVTVVIWRDDGYGLIDWKQRNEFGRPFGVEFGNPDFVAYAESFGIAGFRPSSAAPL